MSGIAAVQLECGATLVVEPNPGVQSVALRVLLPVGSAADPDDRDGEASLLGELIFRGAGGMTSREHSDALDRLGVRRSSSVGAHHLTLAMTCLGDRLPDALPLMTTIVREPAMPAEAMPAVRSLCLQSLDALDDDPQHLVMLRLRERHLPAPFNRHGYGERAVLEQATIEQLRAAWRQRCVPRRTIISAAGAVDPADLARRLDRQLAGWRGDLPEPRPRGAARGGSDHFEQETSQVHIGIACDAPPERDECSMLERLAIAVLSGGTSARLFSEVRQKRSLCYSVGASYRASRDRGLITLYAGTTPERAQQTLDVCLEQLHALSDGVSDEEHQRASVGLKSHTVMQGESTGARASAIARDWFRLGRARTLDELIAAVDAIDIARLDAYVRERRFGPFTMCSIGPVEVNVAEKVG